MDTDTPYLVAFSAFPGIGPVRMRLLISYYGSARDSWLATEESLTEIGLPSAIIRRFVDFRREFDIDGYMRRLKDEHVSVIPYTHPKYPKLLAQIDDAPFLLYIKGKRTSVPLDLEHTIAIVGTRAVTPYGSLMTQRIAHGLVDHGYTVVSGMAYGVDAVAHAAAIDAGGRTVAVLGCGIDIIAPRRNARLYRQICDGAGAIVSEMPLGLTPDKGLFVARNRIISGMSRGVIVVEGGANSGALITARYAAQQGRDVFAVPGPVTSDMSRASAILIKQGAHLVEKAEDVVEILGEQNVTRSPLRVHAVRDMTETEQAILRALSAGQAHIDEIGRTASLTVSELGASLTVLEIRGIVKQIDKNVYVMSDKEATR